MDSRKEFLEDLMSGTDFVKANSGSLMHSREKIPTPLLAINCICGGGLPLSVITRISGHPGGGKSTFSYQCMANYQNKFPNGISVIYDMEASMDNERLQTLGIDTDNVLRLPATTLQQAFKNMFEVLNKLEAKYKEDNSITTFQIYDTLSTGGTDKQQAAIESGGNAFGAGTMMEEPRIIKANLKQLFQYIEKVPIFMGLLEQVFTQPGTYTSKVEASGNFAMKHDAHIHIVFGQPKDDIENGFMVGTVSMVNLEKSKLSPKIMNIPCYIDVTKGGKIDELESFIRYISSDNIGIIKAASWWTIKDTINIMSESYPGIYDDIKQFDKSYRKNDFMEVIRGDIDLLNFFQVRFIDFIDKIYPGQKSINEDYKLELMKNCKYFDKYFEYINNQSIYNNVVEEISDENNINLD